MRFPRFRLRTLMIAVAVLAVLLAAEGYRRRVKYLRIADVYVEIHALQVSNLKTLREMVARNEAELRAIEADIAELRRSGAEPAGDSTEGRGRVHVEGLTPADLRRRLDNRRLSLLIRIADDTRQSLARAQQSLAGTTRLEAMIAASARSYRRAARYPWLPVAPDPPEPR